MFKSNEELFEIINDKKLFEDNNPIVNANISWSGIIDNVFIGKLA